MSIERSIQSYSRMENVNPQGVRQEIKEIVRKARKMRKAQRRERKEKRKLRRRELTEKVIFGTSEYTSRKAVDTFFKGLSRVRSHAPNSIELFKWEDDGMKRLNLDPRKAEDWRKAKRVGKDSRTFFLDSLQDKVIPKDVLLNLADTAATNSVRRSLVALNSELRQLLERYLYDSVHESVMFGVSRGLYGAVPQQDDAASVSLILGEGGLSSYIVSKVDARGDIGNHLERIGGEFASILRTHYGSYRRRMARTKVTGDKVFEESKIDALSKRIFSGSHIGFEGDMHKARALTTAIGLGVTHAMHIATAGSWQKALLAGGEALFSALGAGLVYKSMNPKNGITEQAYTEDQANYNKAIDSNNKRIASTPEAQIDWNETGVSSLRRKLVDKISQRNKQAKTPLEVAPFGVTAVATWTNELGKEYLGVEDISLTNALVTTGLLVSSLAPLIHKPTWYRNNWEREEALNELRLYIDACRLSRFGLNIKTMQDVPIFNIPTYLEKEAERTKRVIEEITKREAALAAMEGKPLIIRTEKNLSAIKLKPGTVSFITAPKGTGKNEFARMILYKQGDLSKINVVKGIDILQVCDLDLFEVNEANPLQGEYTMAEEVATNFILTPEDNLFKEELRKMKSPYDHAEVYRYVHDISPELSRVVWMHNAETRNRVIDILLSDDNSQKEALLAAWLEQPTRKVRDSHDLTDEEEACGVLAIAFHRYLSKVINVKSPEESAIFASSKVGSHLGTSTGEASLWAIRKMLTKELSVGIIDEATAHIGETSIKEVLKAFAEGREDEINASYLLVANLIRSYLKHYPNAILLLTSHERTNLNKYLTYLSATDQYNKEASFVDKEITNVQNQWLAKPVDPSYIGNLLD